MKRAGRLRHRITYQQRATTRDAAGGQSTNWADVASLTNIPAAVTPLSGRELVAAGAVQGEVTHNVEHRYLPGITAALRIRWGSRYFNITSAINVDERNVDMIISCKEGTASG